MERKIVPVILAGGSGSRLWPVSRESYPKQFCKLYGDLSLLQETATRAKMISCGADLIIITNDNYYFLCKDQMESIGIHNVRYILEPCSRNTSPAIALAASYSCEFIDPNSTLLILPSDHYMNDPTSFNDAVTTAVDFSDLNKLVIFGVRPTAPKTGYGYIEKGDPFGKTGFTVSRFVEKPSLDVAKEYLAQGNFYWNSGMFLFKAETYLDELEVLANDIYVQCTAAYKATKQQGEFFRVSKDFSSCRNASIDYEIMEKTTKAVMLPLSINWNDLGCWASMAETGEADENGNVLQGNVIAYESENCLISSEERRVVVMGIKDQLVIGTSDAVLVANKAYSQDVKKIVEQMKSQHDLVATEHKRVYRPWGFYETLASAPGYQVKYLMLKPHATISLQLHHHRSEHWVVVSGVAEIVNGEKIFRLHANQSTYIEKKSKHRLSNPENQPLLVIEVQSGDYLGEDDIIRFEDIYGRIDEANLLVVEEL